MRKFKTPLPGVVIHNSVSLDGSLLGFDVDMQEHYKIAGTYKPDVHLIGSNTVKAGMEMYEKRIPGEEQGDFVKPKRDKSLPFWVIPDTKGKLKGLLHICRRFEFCRDVVILASEKTPRNYLHYLRERNYDCHIAGTEKVDYLRALRILAKKYKAKTVLTDTGMILNCILLDGGLVDEISLLFHPVIVGAKKQFNMFRKLNKNLDLELIKSRKISGNKLWMVYKVKR